MASKTELKIIIFDLDDVLINTTACLKQIRKETIKAMVEKGLKGNANEILKEWYEEIAKKDSNNPFQLNILCKRHNIFDKEDVFETNNNRIVAAGRLAYHKTKLIEIQPDENLLSFLKELKKEKKILIVTRGMSERQWEKIYLAKLDEVFSPEDIFVIDEKDPRDKTELYKFISKKYKTHPENIAIIDDRISGITDANKAKMKATLYLNKNGKYYEKAKEELEKKEIIPYSVIHEIKEIKDLI